MPARGFTLIELVVAITMLAVGVLAVAGSAVPLARLVRRGGARTAAAEAAAARIETLRAAGCGAGASGWAAGGGARITWSAVSGGGLEAITVVATYAWDTGLHSDTYEVVVACAP